jgi:hypothetical protein
MQLEIYFVSAASIVQFSNINWKKLGRGFITYYQPLTHPAKYPDLGKIILIMLLYQIKIIFQRPERSLLF